MVQILQRPEKQDTLGEKFGRAFSSGSQVASQNIPQRLMGQQTEARENEALQRLTGKDLSGLSPEIKKNFAQTLAKSPENERIRDALISQGVDEKDADLYTLLTVGGQTSFVKDILEKKKRQGKSNEQLKEYGEQDQVDELENIIQNQDEGLTPAEKVKRGIERYSSGEKVRAEASERLKGLSRNRDRFDILESLNKSGKLPKDLGRLNINPKNGELYAPFAASPEAQRYIKTFNEFASGAKDTFGSRVTNFDLESYMKQFPSLMNSEEGRKQLLQQLKIVNDINSVYYKNLQDVYRKAGGARKVDADVAQDLAERRSESQVQELSKKFQTIGQFTSKPAASEFKGRKIEDEDTGEIFISDGENWIPEE